MECLELMVKTLSSFCTYTKQSIILESIPKEEKIDYAKCETVISDEIDKINDQHFEKIKGKLNSGEDLLPNCDLNVWLRDYKNETPNPILGRTTGRIPHWVKGCLIRNGPGALTIGESSFNHLFDASAVLHRFAIKNGQATYQSKFLKSSSYIKNQMAQRIVVSEFGTCATPDPCKTIFQRFATIFNEEETDNCMISVYPFRDHLYALGEFPKIYRIDSETLDTICPVNVSKYVNIVHHTSHPHVLEDGTVYNLGLSITPTGPKYAIMKFPHTCKDEPRAKDVFSEAEIVAKVRTRWPFYPGYMHTFGMTENYFVIVEQPMSLDVPEKFRCKINRKPLCNALKFYDGFPTLFHVVSRRTGKQICSFTSEPFFYLHIINQYEEDNFIIVDICVYKDAKMMDCMLIESLKKAKQNPDYANLFRGRPVRFVLPINPSDKVYHNLITLKGTKAKAYRTRDGDIHVIPEILCKLGCETPRINYPLHLGVKYRYFYGISADVDAENPGTLIKVDVLEKSCKTWSSEIGVFPCEPIFVPNPDPKAEDDGVVLSSLLWTSDETKVGLVIIDGQTFKEIAQTEFKTAGPVPKCLHGWFVDS